MILEHTDHLYIFSSFLYFFFFRFYNTKFTSMFHSIKVEYKTGKGVLGATGCYHSLWSIDGKTKRSDSPKENISQSKTPKDHTSL